MTETIKELICICCPKGCHLRVDTANDYAVTGNACPNGAAYGKEELTQPPASLPAPCALRVDCTRAARSKPRRRCQRKRCFP